MGTVVSYEEWLSMPEVSDEVEEVVDGELIRVPPPKWPHAHTVLALRATLDLQIDRLGIMVITAQFGLVISKAPLKVRIPDLSVFQRSRVIALDGYIHSAPELISEVLSPAEDIKSKLRDYQDLGVPEVWVLSPEARTFEILQLQDGKLRTVSTLREGQIRPLKFPNVVVDATSVWPD